MNAARLAIVSMLLLLLLSTACSDDATSGGDGDASEGDAAMPGDGDGDGDGPVVPVSCEEDVECDNGVYCDGEERCVDGACADGDRVTCDDGIACTLDECLEDAQTCSSTPPDADQDGHLDGSCIDADGEPYGDDCDDADGLRFPGNIEICDLENRDEDCDPQTIGFRDADNDNFVDALCCNAEDDSDGAALRCGDDCDDLKANVHPTATEACDLFDNDCDGETDEGVSVMLYPDADRDGHGSDSAAAEARCAGAVGYAADPNDCDDADPEVFEGQFEICDGKDNNCDDSCEGEDPGCTDNIDEVQEHAPWFADVDEDGFGSSLGQPILSCIPIPGRRLSNNDCDDEDSAVHPAASEACDAIDNDCNGLRDFRIGLNDFEDDDTDGQADAACVGGDDCDDRDPTTGAGLDEICDRIDNDCDGAADEETVQTVWYLDEDGDGWGVGIGNALASCDPLPGRSSRFGDCADAENSRHPGAREQCNGIDDDCDGAVDEQASFLCKLDNSVARCGEVGTCEVFSCVSGFADVDQLAGNGCEAVAVPQVIPGFCNFDFECDDELYCNGKERCDQFSGNCLSGTPINCQPDVQGDVHIADSVNLVQLQGVEVIAGHVLIDATDIRSLIGLDSLRVIGGNLTIIGANELRRLSGSALSNLEFVGGHIRIENNAELIDVNLPSLISARSLQIRNNPKLPGVVGFPSLVSLDDGLVIAYNNTLLEVDGFEALAVIDGDVDDQFGEGAPPPAFSISQNPVLSELKGFGVLESIRGAVELVEGALTSITFPGLRTLGNALAIFDQPQLEEMSFPVLTEVRGDVVVELAPAVTSLGLDALTDAGGIQVGGTLSLSSIDLPELRQVGRPPLIDEGQPFYASDSIALFVSFSGPSNEALTQLSAPLLQAVQGDVYVEAQPMLQSIDLPALSMINGDLILFDNDALVSVDVDMLQGVNLVEVAENNVLASLAMPALMETYGNVIIGANPILQSVQMPMLAMIGSELRVMDNDALATLDMQNLQSVDRFVSIVNNGSMTNLDGLASLDTVVNPPDLFTGVEVCANFNLPDQLVQAFLAQFAQLDPNQLHDFCGQGE